MANKIESAIKRMLGKNERAAKKAKRKSFVAEAVTDSTMTPEQIIEAEKKRRRKFAAPEEARRAMMKNKKKVKP